MTGAAKESRAQVYRREGKKAAKSHASASHSRWLVSVHWWHTSRLQGFSAHTVYMKLRAHRYHQESKYVLGRHLLLPVSCYAPDSSGCHDYITISTAAGMAWRETWHMTLVYDAEVESAVLLLSMSYWKDINLPSIFPPELFALVYFLYIWHGVRKLCDLSTLMWHWDSSSIIWIGCTFRYHSGIKRMLPSQQGPVGGKAKEQSRSRNKERVGSANFMSEVRGGSFFWETGYEWPLSSSATNTGKGGWTLGPLGIQFSYLTEWGR